jgi:hypothetical protein
LDSLEDNFPYTLMGEYILMLYPYITLFLFVLSLEPNGVTHLKAPCQVQKPTHGEKMKFSRRCFMQPSISLPLPGNDFGTLMFLMLSVIAHYTLLRQPRLYNSLQSPSITCF